MTRLPIVALLACASLLALACGRRNGAERRTGASGAAARAARGVPCGALGCRQYDDVRDAMEVVLASNPLVLAVGEAHAPKGASVPSAAKRFTDDVLPLLRGRASDLLVELMMAPSGCRQTTEAARAEQAPVTAQQAETNQGEYIAMGTEARLLGEVPDTLRPSCADLAAIADAGDGAIDLSLRTIARLTVAQATHLVERDALSDADRGKMVIIYGGALHNDLPAPAGPALDASPWSYAPALDAVVHGRLIAIDLIVPEYIGDDATWRSLDWWPAYDAGTMGAKVTLFTTGDQSFTLVFQASSRR